MTDNGSNFVTAFYIFGEEIEDPLIDEDTDDSNQEGPSISDALIAINAEVSEIL